MKRLKQDRRPRRSQYYLDRWGGGGGGYPYSWGAGGGIHASTGVPSLSRTPPPPSGTMEYPRPLPAGPRTGPVTEPRDTPSKKGPWTRDHGVPPPLSQTNTRENITGGNKDPWCDKGFKSEIFAVICQSYNRIKIRNMISRM